ncbi:MAG TPA: diadenylate cyclase CdaA [Prolixibacteraceae bacterium]|nr:diadenylate cyclase CdaA [Prolixibacteraceae bacterium]
MTELFIHFKFLDLLDILFVAILFYELYNLVRGTVTFSIFLGIFIVFMVWVVVRALKMELLGSILSNLFGVGFLALIVVFQQEIRRFLLMLGNSYRNNKRISIESLFSGQFRNISPAGIKSIVDACIQMSKTKTGALIVISRENELKEYVRTGEFIDSEIRTDLVSSIFFKNSPLHDGAAIVVSNRIQAVRCILPVSSSQEIKPSLGLRHRAAIGMSEVTDAFIIIVSEETGRISIAENGKLIENISPDELFRVLQSDHKS